MMARDLGILRWVWRIVIVATQHSAGALAHRGMMLLLWLGLVQTVCHCPDACRPTTPLAGASCGAIIVACINVGMSNQEIVNALMEFATDCR